MARINFRQGIVRHQEDTGGNPTFLQVVGGNVNLIVSPDPTIVSFIDGTTDYLFTEGVTVNAAWGPFTAGIDRWLYWDLNIVTGVRTFGFTTFEPVEQSTAPTSPSAGQMWFDTTVNNWFEWSGSSWTRVIRVFSCKLDVGLAPQSMSINSPSFKGTQVGITGTFRVGSIAYDQAGSPIRKGQTQFFTTEDLFVTGVPTGAQLRVNNILIQGQAQQPIAAYQVVEYTDYNRLVPASPTNQGELVYGIVEEDAATNALINFVTEGVIFNDDWDWPNAGADVNDPVYISPTGEIQLTEGAPGALPVGVIIGPQSILFSPGLFPQVFATVLAPQAFPELTDTPADYVGANSQFVKVNAAADGLEFVNESFANAWGDLTGTLSNQTDLQAELDDKVDLAGDTMDSAANLTFVGGGEVFGLPALPTTQDAAASKEYVDMVFAGRTFLDPVLDPDITGIDVNTPPVTPVTRDESFIIGAAATGDWNVFAAGSVVGYNGTAWVNLLGRPVQVGDRFGITMEPQMFPSLNLDASVSSDVGKIITITGDTPGSITWDTFIPDEFDSVFVNNEQSLHFAHTYTFQGVYGVGTYGTEFKWLETNAPVEIIAGNFLTFAGNVLNVDENFNRIFDTDQDTFIDTEVSADDDNISIQTGENSSGTGGRIVVQTGDGEAASGYNGGDISFTTGRGATGFPPGAAGGDFTITTGVGGEDENSRSGNIRIETSGVGAYGYGGKIELVTGDGAGDNTTTSNIDLFPGANGIAFAETGYVNIVSSTAAAAAVETGIVLVPKANTVTKVGVGFKPPTTVGAQLVWELPAVDGTIGQFLSTDGAGVLSWASAAGGGSSSRINDADDDTFVETQNVLDGDNNIIMQAGESDSQNQVTTPRGSIEIFAGDATEGAELPYRAGQITIKGGQGNLYGDGHGGSITIEAGEGRGYGGAGSGADGTPGNIVLTAGDSSPYQPGPTTLGGSIDITAGEGYYTGGGPVNIASGLSEYGDGGAINIKAGRSAAYADNNVGGGTTIWSGWNAYDAGNDIDSAGAGGNIHIRSGGNGPNTINTGDYTGRNLPQGMLGEHNSASGYAGSVVIESAHGPFPYGGGEYAAQFPASPGPYHGRGIILMHGYAQRQDISYIGYSGDKNAQAVNIVGKAGNDHSSGQLRLWNGNTHYPGSGAQAGYPINFDGANSNFVGLKAPGAFWDNTSESLNDSYDIILPGNRRDPSNDGGLIMTFESDEQGTEMIAKWGYIPYDIQFDYVGSPSDGQYIGFWKLAHEVEFFAFDSTIQFLVNRRAGPVGTNAVFEVGRFNQVADPGPATETALWTNTVMPTDNPGSSNGNGTVIGDYTLDSQAFLYCKCVTSSSIADIGITLRGYVRARTDIT